MSKIYSLNDRGFLKVSGPDSIKFMQGYTTCDLAALVENMPQSGAICNIQGRMLTSFLVVRSADDLMLRMHRPLVTKAIDFLKKYIVFSKAELADISETLTCYGAQTVSEELDTSGGYCLDLGNRIEYWMPSELPVVSEPDNKPWLDLEIEAGIAWVTDKTSEEYLPQMFNYHQLKAIDFEKGCYLGQEIVARAQYRGNLKRRLHRVVSSQRRQVGEKFAKGEVVAVGTCELLAVIQNSGDTAVSITFEDGETCEALSLHQEPEANTTENKTEK